VNGKTVVASRTYGERIGIDALMNTLLRDRHFYEESGGGITFSGGEPLMQPDALESLLKACRKHGLHTTIDTSGFARRELFERMMDHTDLFLFDLKNMEPGLHLKYTGVDNGLILSNADYLLEKGARVIFRIPVIPGINTSDDEIDRMVAFVEERREALEEVHLLPYHRIAENKYLKLRIKQQLPEAEEPDRNFMDQLSKRFGNTGLDISIGG